MVNKIRTDVVLRREVTQEAHITVYHKKGTSAWTVIEEAKELAEEGDYDTSTKHMTYADSMKGGIHTTDRNHTTYYAERERKINDGTS